MNVKDSDATIMFGYIGSRGAMVTRHCIHQYRRPMFLVERPDIPSRAHSECADWIIETGVEVLNVAGNRESIIPGIGAWTEHYLCEVFRLLGFEEVAS